MASIRSQIGLVLFKKLLHYLENYHFSNENTHPGI